VLVGGGLCLCIRVKRWGYYWVSNALTNVCFGSPIHRLLGEPRGSCSTGACEGIAWLGLACLKLPCASHGTCIEAVRIPASLACKKHSSV
jgi:hypothetical protein